MAKPKKSKAAKRSGIARARRFARDNGSAIALIGAGIAGAAAIMMGRSYRDRRAVGD